METIRQLSEIAAELRSVRGKLNKIDRDLGKLEGFSVDPLNEIRNIDQSSTELSKIIPFPVPAEAATRSNSPRGRFIFSPILALPGKPLPQSIPDYRPFLQRDGLILLAWDMRMTEMGERFTAYWITSKGVSRFYASKPLSSDDFAFARPDRKSYAAEDGIEFYGQPYPDYLVHIAPELMKSNPWHGDLRQIHIEKLKLLGSDVDFDYKYLLKTEKNRNLRYKKPNGEDKHQAG